MVFQRRDTAVLTADKMVHKDANARLKREKSICSRNWHVLVQSSAVETGICFCLAGITLFWVSLGLLGISFWSVLMQFEWQVVCMYMSACVRFMIWVIKMLCIIIFGRALIFEIERQLLFLTRMNIVSSLWNVLWQQQQCIMVLAFQDSNFNLVLLMTYFYKLCWLR